MAGFRTWRLAALVYVLCAVSLPIAARGIAGPPGARVNVRWQPSVDQGARARLETRFQLTDGERLDEFTWRYDLVDPSPENVRAIVAEPLVADTHHIDRPHAALELSAERTARRLRFRSYGNAVVETADIVAVTLALFGGVFAFAALSSRVAWIQILFQQIAHGGRRSVGAVSHLAGAVRRFLRPVEAIAAIAVRFVERGVPEIDAPAAGLFRIVFLATTLTFFAYPTHHVDATWLATTFDSEVQGAIHLRVMEWLGMHPIVADLITPWLIVFGALALAGVLTRATYALFVAGVVLWAYVAMSVESTHPHSTLVLTLVALLPARWADARSIDSWRRRRHGSEPVAAPSKRYGYTVWVPVLTFGVGFAAAAWAKLTVPPAWTSWVLNGTIKYHIISDVASAPVDWGLYLLRHPILAVIVSFGAIAVEALVVTAAFTRSQRYRLALGMAAAALFAGIGLLMGIVWPGWWIPLLAFLPWPYWSQHRRSSDTDPAAVTARRIPIRSLTAAQLIVVAGVLSQQVVVSALRLERAPMFSWYDMYSRSYDSPDDYSASIPPVYHIVIAGADGVTELRCNPHEEFVRDFQDALQGKPEPRDRVWRSLRGCGADLQRTRSVMLEGRARTFDWDRMQFAQTYPVSLGPLVRQDE